MAANEIIWINNGWQPVNIGFCPSKKAWKKFFKEIPKQKGFEIPKYLTSFARTTCLDSESKGRICLVSLNEAISDTKDEVYGILVHEAVHVWQHVKEYIGEENPSSEFECYSIQYISQQLWEAYNKSKEMTNG